MNDQNATGGAIVPRLSIMMFIQFFIWGAWYVTTGNYMVAHDMANVIGWAYTVGPIAAILSPIFLGMVADRYFATERVLATMHFLGGIFMFMAPVAAGISPTAFILVLLLHMLCYMPTLGLTNTLAFHNITNQEKQFPVIRVFGTIGWIVANWVVSKWLHADKEAMQFYVTGGACIALGLFSLSLPHTPPPAKGKKASLRGVLGIDAAAYLLRNPSFVIFIISSFLICIPLAAYYAYAPVFVDVSAAFADAVGKTDVAFIMSFGQISEIFFMLVMPLCFARLGVKKMLLIGMFAWVARYGLFAVGAPTGVAWMIMIGILLHGICYDFFFVTGQIYTDKKSTPEIRGQAQGFLVLVTLGLGMLIGAQVSQALFNGIVTGEGDVLRESYKMFWLIPCLAAGVVMAVFAMLFKDDVEAEQDSN